MPKITKDLDMGGGYKITVGINDGIAVMSSNYGKYMEEIYFKARQAGKLVEFNRRTNTMIEKFDCTAEEFAKKIDIDYKIALFEQNKVMKEAETRIEENKK